MASSTSSSIFFALFLLLICSSVLLLIRYYLPLRTTPSYLLVPVFLALALPSSIILLVPIDLASSGGADTSHHRGIWLSDRALLVSWRITYWLTFCLTWFILPLLGEYADAGAREPRARLLYSVRSNARYQLIYLACAVLGAVYFFMQAGFNPLSLRAIVMALAYTWGLVLALYLMGNGLVAIPKRLFKDASVSGRLRRLYEQAPGAHERMTDSMDALAELEAQVVLLQQKKTGSAREFQDWIEELAEGSRLPESIVPGSAGGGTPAKLPNVITERYLAEFARKLKRARHKRARFADEWVHLVQKASMDRQIIDSHTNKSLVFETDGQAARATFPSNLLTPRSRYHLHTHIIPAARLGSAGILSLASACIVWSELVKHALPRTSIINLTVVHRTPSSRGQLSFGNQLLAACWLSYMCAAALYSVTQVRVWGNRALVRRGTYPESACWYAGQVAKLTVPLAYNFAEMIDAKVLRGTMFYHFLGRLVDLTPLGAGFSAWFPVFIVVPVAASVFGLYGKVKRWTGLGGDWVLPEDEEEERSAGQVLMGSGSWREGQSLIERELQGASGQGSVGLLSRDTGRSSAPGRDGPGASGNADAGPPHTRGSALRDANRGAEQHRARRRLDEAGDGVDDENFFQGFARRVKNTFDGAERPAWLDNVRPRWMDNDSSNNGGGTGGAGGGGVGNGNGEGGPNLGRWFGGRAREGQVRL